MNSFFISIIIPFHNRLDYIFELIESIKEKSNVEIIMVDDSSSENLYLRKIYENKDIKVIKLKSNQRYAGTARNVGIENAFGEYVFFADSDDLINNEGFLNCIEILKSNKPDILFCKMDSFKNTDRSRGKRHIRNNWLINRVKSGESYEILARFVNPVSKFIRREFLKQHFIQFETQQYSNDIFFSALLIIYNPRIEVTDEVVYLVREGHSSLTSEISIESTAIRLEALNKYNRLLENNGLGYLMAPAFPLLKRMWFKNKKIAVKWASKIFKSNQPVLTNWWSFKNLILRKLLFNNS